MNGSSSTRPKPESISESKEMAGAHQPSRSEDKPTRASPFAALSWLDRLLGPLVLIAMIVGVLIGHYGNGVDSFLQGASFKGVSIPIMVGLLVMMWPIMAKVQYERLPALIQERSVWKQIGISMFLNWIIGPFVMLGLAWATLPDLPGYRAGVIIVGIARCIAMVMIWNQLANGNSDLCAILVIINSLLQLVLFSPFSVFFLKVISGDNDVRMSYQETSIAVGIYLGIPLAAGMITRFSLITLLGRNGFNKFMRFFGPVALLGLLYTIILICMEQADRIIDNIGNVFRVFVPLILYFCFMWTGTFITMYLAYRSKSRHTDEEKYHHAVVQSFTAGSNNFELAIAVCVAIYGVDSDQALASTIGPLVEVPVLLCLSYLSLYLRHRLQWSRGSSTSPETVTSYSSTL